ncbi:MAG TPA: hypothetical protein VN893_10195 [Bryobacteraceae bacterium]|nr:hypothetical protein [Bryobacteraceae bacterium]
MQFPNCSEGVQLFCEFVAGSAEAGLVAAEAGEDAGFVEQGAEGEGVADVGAAGLELLFDRGFAAADFDFEEGGLHGRDAVEAPAGGDELFDQVGFVGIGGFEVGHEEVAEGDEVLFGFVSEEDAAGCEAVGDRGHVGAGAAFGCGGSAGLGAVGARSVDSLLR